MAYSSQSSNTGQLDSLAIRRKCAPVLISLLYWLSFFFCIDKFLCFSVLFSFFLYRLIPLLRFFYMVFLHWLFLCWFILVLHVFNTESKFLIRLFFDWVFREPPLIFTSSRCSLDLSWRPFFFNLTLNCSFTHYFWLGVSGEPFMFYVFSLTVPWVYRGGYWMVDMRNHNWL